jgi:hypothetical protein
MEVSRHPIALAREVHQAAGREQKQLSAAAVVRFRWPTLEQELGPLSRPGLSRQEFYLTADLLDF